MLSDVDAEGRGGPVADGLNVVKGGAGLGEGCGSSAAHGLASNVAGEESAEAGEEPGAGWNGAVGTKPEVGEERVKGIARVKVGAESESWVVWGREGAENNAIALKEGVGFVGRQEKGDGIIGKEGHRGTEGDFPV